jgi:Ran GTPase-activating protein (RanGAP) involved in mRNA processing and transport
LPGWSPGRFDLELREEALLHDHGEAWLSALPWPECDFKHIPRWWSCRRGLLRLGMHLYEELGACLQQGGPWLWVDGLGLVSYSGEAALAGLPAQSQLTALELRWNLGAGDIADLLRHWPYAAGLRELAVSGEGAAAHAVAEAKNLKSLTRLQITGMGLGPSGAAALARSDVLSQVRYLDLSNNEWLGFHEGQGVKSLARSRKLGAVTSLKLRKIRMESPGLEELLHSRLFRQLREFDLSRNALGEGALAAGLPTKGKPLPLESWDLTDCGLGESDIVAIADSPRLGNLRRLLLSGNRLGKRGGRALLDSPHLNQIVALSLGQAGLKAADVARLAERPASAALVSLDLADNKLGADSARALAGSPHVRELAHLSLSHSALGQEGMEAVLALPGLRRLELAGCELGPVAVEALARSPALARLTMLDLSANRVGARGAAALAASPHVGGLAELRLANCAIGTKALAALVGAGNLASLRRLDLRQNSLHGKEVVEQLQKWPLSAQLTEIRLERNGFSRGEACQLHDLFGKRLRAALY